MTALDLKENISALTVAILSPEAHTVEDAFSLLSEGVYFKRNETHERKQELAREWVELKEQGVSVPEIAKIFGRRYNAVWKAIERYEHKEVNQ